MAFCINNRSATEFIPTGFTHRSVWDWILTTGRKFFFFVKCPILALLWCLNPIPTRGGGGYIVPSLQVHFLKYLNNGLSYGLQTFWNFKWTNFQSKELFLNRLRPPLVTIAPSKVDTCFWKTHFGSFMQKLTRTRRSFAALQSLPKVKWLHREWKNRLICKPGKKCEKKQFTINFNKWTFLCGLRFIQLSKVAVLATWNFSQIQNVFAENFFILQFCFVWHVSLHKKKCKSTLTSPGKCWTALLLAFLAQKLR